MKKLLVLLSLVLLVVGCQKVDLNNLAFPSEELEVYTFEAYEDQEIEIPSQYAIDPSNRTLITMQSHSEETGEDYTIYGVYIGDMNTISTDTVILYLHGQSKHMDNYYSRASLLANVGGKHNYGVLMIDYRGYGLSEGSPTEKGLYEDADAAIDWLVSKGAIGSRTIIYGYSLGAIPSIDRCAYREDFISSKLIIESPLASVENLVHSSTLINVDPGFVTTLEFNNAEKIKDVSQPLYWMHGVEDTYIAIQNGELIYSNHMGTHIADRVEGSDHSEVPVKMGFEYYLSRLSYFIQN